MREKIGRPRRGGTNRNEALAAELLSPVPGSRMARKIQRRQWPIMGGRARAGDRGRPPKVLEERRGRTVRGLGSEYESSLRWKATGRPQWRTRAENRARTKRQRAARKANR